MLVRIPGADRQNREMASFQASALPLRIQLPVYGVALFSNSVPDLVLVIMQLWLVSLGAPPALMGIVLGCRYVGPLLFAIHGGAMMERLGTGRVLAVFAAIMMAVPPIYPLTPWVPAIVALQLVSGLADSLGWVGAQTLTGQVLRGSPTYTGRLVFATRIGTFVGPPLAGAAWDLFGPWGGFLTLAVWGAGMLASVLALPPGALPPPTEFGGGRLRAVMPRLVDYISAARLAAIPLVGLVLMATIIRQFGSGMQSTFYAVYLDSVGISGTVIGLLVAATGVTGIAALGSGWLARRFNEFRLLLLSTALSIATIAVVPFFTDPLPLFVASGLRGIVLALSVVYIVSLIARSVAPEVQGRAMGLRTTCNQVANVVIPVVMGLLAQLWGLEVAFYAVGVTGLALLAVLSAVARRIEVPRT